MKKQILTLTILAAIGVSAPLQTFAAKAAKASPSPTAEAKKEEPKKDEARAIPFRGTISAVDKTAKTFSIKGKEKTRVFTITDQTKLTKGDTETAATWDDLTVGQEVRGSAKKTGEDAYEAASVKVGPKTEKAADKNPKASASASPTAKPKK